LGNIHGTGGHHVGWFYPGFWLKRRTGQLVGEYMGSLSGKNWATRAENILGGKGRGRRKPNFRRGETGNGVQKVTKRGNLRGRRIHPWAGKEKRMA